MKGVAVAYGEVGNRKTVGHVSIAADVLTIACRTVEDFLNLYPIANDEWGNWLLSEAVASWAWIKGDHGIRLPASYVYEAVGLDGRDAVPVLRERFDRIDAKLMQLIDDEAAAAIGWALPLPDTVRKTPPDQRMRNKGEHDDD